ncbi:MAG: radical SAM protein [Deltaproteobacteria bacterium]|nr:radical SAM protein [Deltaproteobacteria bacterium]
MNALFFVPPVELNRRKLPVDRVYGCNYGYDYKPPIHFLQLATVARDWLGWNVRLVDCPAEGLDLAAFEAVAEGVDVAVAQSVYLSAEEDLLAMRAVRARNPGLKAVFFGTAPTWKPAEFLDDEHSYALLGEPELTLRELDAAWRTGAEPSGIEGLAWRRGGRVFRTGFRALLDVSTLPMPDRRLLKGKYRANRLDVHPITTLVVSRGCGFRCTFCTPNGVDQMIELEFKRLQPSYTERPPLRKRTVDQIVAEFEDIAAQGFKGVEVADNIFTWGKERTREICARIAPLGLHWICLARANMLHDGPTIRAMADAGCKLVYMGSESFDDGLLDDMQKELKVKDVHRAVTTCRENGVEPEVSVLMGASPLETWRTLFNSWRSSRQLGTRFVHFSVALPSPSTEMYDTARREGWFIDGDFFPADNQRDVIVNLPNLSARELRAALKLAYVAQYLSPAGVGKQVRKVSSMADLKHKAKSAARLLGFLGSGQAADREIPPGRVTSPQIGADKGLQAEPVPA